MMMSLRKIALIALVVLFLAPQDVLAQEIVPATTGEAIPMGISSPAAEGTPPAPAGDPVAPAPADATAEVTTPAGADPKAINPNDMQSVLFTYWEHTAIIDMKKSVGETREVTPEELAGSLRGREVNRPKPPPEEREIRLGGIVYVTSGEWTIWLNDKRVTPKAIPRQVMDLKVYKEYIEMKWFDDYTNQIFPLRLRTHQRFNIDSRIFLPG